MKALKHVKKQDSVYGATGTLEKLECYKIVENDYSDPISSIPRPTLTEAGHILNKLPYVNKKPDDVDRPLIFVAENRLGRVIEAHYTALIKVIPGAK